MKSYQINAQLPFSWCRFCNQMDLKEERFMADGEIYETVRTCENAQICEECEKASMIYGRVPFAAVFLKTGTKNRPITSAPTAARA